MTHADLAVRPVDSTESGSRVRSRRLTRRELRRSLPITVGRRMAIIPYEIRTAFEIRAAATRALKPHIGGSSTAHLARFTSLCSLGATAVLVLVVLAAASLGFPAIVLPATFLLVVTLSGVVLSMLALEGYDTITRPFFDGLVTRIGVRALGGPGSLSPSRVQQHGYLGRITRNHLRRARLDDTSFDTFLRLLPEWDGTLHELITASRSL